jgi:stress-induced-phosphoprotein 1
LGRIGNSYLKLKNFEQAIKYFEKSLTEHRTPDILTKLRDTEKLKKEADKEAYRNPTLSDEARELGNTAFKSQDYATAIKHYSEAIKRNDSDARNYTNRAASYIKLMALPEADKDCDEAIRLDPSFVKGYIRKAAVYVAKRDFVKAMDWCKTAKEKDTEGKSTTEIDQLVGLTVY